MAISLEDLLNLQPSVVSRDLSGYITYIYGPPKVGKTTLAKDMEALILACEDGTRAMSGAYDMIMKTWGDIKSIVRYAKNEKIKAKFKAIAVDTVDVAATLCEKYVCNQNDVDALGKVPYGGGWSAFKKEFEDVFRTLSLEGYAILFISHNKTKTITRQNGTEYTKIVPTVSDSINNIVMNMSDIIGYAYQDENDGERYLILRSDGSVEAGTRFPYMESKIKFGYKYLVEALNNAIDETEKREGSDAVVDTRPRDTSVETYDYDSLMNEFQSIVGDFMNKDATYYQPRITQIIEKYLGKGKKISDTSLDQAELVFYIVKEIKEELK